MISNTTSALRCAPDLQGKPRGSFSPIFSSSSSADATAAARLASARASLHLLLCLALLAACPQPAEAESNSAIAVQGSGSTLLGPLFSGWIPTYTATDEARRDGVSLSYGEVGSGAGLRDILLNRTYWAGSEAVLTEEEYAVSEGVLMLPVVSAPIALVFNLDGVTTALTLSREVVVQIFSGDIMWWDDSAITSQNRLVTLPHKPIEVVVRGDSSGTSFVMSSSLMAFGWNATQGCQRLQQCGVTKKLSQIGFGYTAKEGSTALAEYVKATPYSIGYVGVATALEKRVPFCIVQNKAGLLTVASREDAEVAADSSEYDSLRLTAEVHDKAGYPLLGIAYLVYWQRYSPRIALQQPGGGVVTEAEVGEACKKHDVALRFLYWVYTSNRSADIIKGGNLVPVTPQVGNRAVGRLWDSQCDGARWKDSNTITSVVTFDHTTDVSLNALAYSYHLHIARDRIVSSVKSPASAHGDPTDALRPANSLLALRRASLALAYQQGGVAHTGPSTQHLTWVPLWSYPLVFIYNVGVAGLRVSLEIPVSVAGGILSGKVVHWLDEKIRGDNAHLPLPQKGIKIVGHASLLDPVLAELGVEAAWGARQFDALQRALENSTSEQEVAEYVASHTGTLAVVSRSVAELWALAEIHPIPAGGLSGRAPDDDGYPFHAVAYIGVPRAMKSLERNPIPQADGVDPVPVLPKDGIVSAVAFAQWLSGAAPHGQPSVGSTLREAASLIEKSGMAPLIRDAQLRGAIDAFFEGVTADGEPLFPAPPAPPGEKPPLSATAIALICAGCVSAVLALLAVSLKRHATETAKVKRLLTNSAVAENSAECIAEMRLEELEYLKDIRNPNKIQQAFIKITDMLVEYRRYLPSSVLMRGDGGAVDESSDDFQDDCSSFAMGEAGGAHGSGVGRSRSHEDLSPDETPFSSRDSASSAGRSEQRKPEPGRARLSKFHLGLQRRRSTVAAIALDVASDVSGSAFSAFLTVLEATLLKTSHLSRKTSVQITNDGVIFLSWNTAASIVSHATVGLDVLCALKKGVRQFEAQQQLQQHQHPPTSPRNNGSESRSLDEHSTATTVAPIALRASIGISSDNGYCGNVGGDTSRVFVVNGTAVSNAKTLMAYAKATGSFCIADDSVLGGICHSYDCYRVDLLSLTPDGKRTYLWDVSGKEGHHASEWMYELQQVEEERRRTVPGLASLMWEAIRRREVAKLKGLRDDFLQLLPEAQAKGVLYERLLTCTEEVLEERDTTYYADCFRVIPREVDLETSRTTSFPSAVHRAGSAQSSSRSPGVPLCIRPPVPPLPPLMVAVDL